MDYRNPDQLPDGPVLVVGAGNSGVQIAVELARTRPVTIAVGARQPALPQRFLGRDLFSWLNLLGVMRIPADSRLGRRLRERDPLIGTSLRHLQRQGVQVRDRVTAADGRHVHTADGHHTSPTTIVWATGYRPAYRWLTIPNALDTNGRPRHTGGISPILGLYHLGLPYQRTRGSALLGWVGHDVSRLNRCLSEHSAVAGRCQRGGPGVLA